MVNALSILKDINTIIIKSSGSEIDLNPCIEAIKQKLKDLALPKREDTTATILTSNPGTIRVKAMEMTRAIAIRTTVINMFEPITVTFLFK
jgi:5-formyltetrahydrofolate cyclo-ligase